MKGWIVDQLIEAILIWFTRTLPVAGLPTRCLATSSSSPAPTAP